MERFYRDDLDAGRMFLAPKACHQTVSGAKSNGANSLLRHGAEGHGFSHAAEVGPKARTFLPKAGVKPAGRND
jgi:hypothetical protein